MKLLLTIFWFFSINFLFSQNFIHQLKPIYWKSATELTNNVSTLNGYNEIKQLENFKVNSKNVTVFLVVKSNIDALNKVIFKNNDVLKFTNHNKASIEKGVLYASNLNSFKKIIYNFSLDNKSIAFYEVLIFDKMITEEEKQKIETYLSLKFGVSLSKTSNYTNNTNNIIWDNEKLNQFNDNVTGVGVFKDLDFNQLKSQNSEDAYLEIELKPENLTKEKYVLFGNNSQEEKIWFLKKEHITKRDKIEFRYKDNIQKVVLVLASDENFKNNVTYIPLIKKENCHSSEYISIDDFQYFKFNYDDWDNVSKEITDTPNHQWIVYPNPNNGKFYLEFNFEETLEVKYTLMDVLGKVITEKKLGKIEKLTHAVDENLANGLYLIKVETDNETHIKKLIVKQ
ncbi:MAG: T9SS type A sorting domain-containing protein [Flavobacteriales bacterium]|nr:T9SS type A sorting domain-containing protein [Flavobacteriales bacterium]